MDNSLFTKMRKAISGFTAFTLVFSFMVVPTTAQAATGFNDVSSDHYAYDAIMELVDAGVVSGYGNGNFGPDDTVTREQAAKILVNAFAADQLDPDYVHGFTDATSIDPNLEDYVNTAAKLGIMEGDPSGTSRPKDQVTRYEWATLAVRAMGAELVSESEADAGLAAEFGDYSSMPGWAKVYVATAWQNSVLNGYENGKFGGADPATRGQAALMTLNAQNPVFREFGTVVGPTTPSGDLMIELNETYSPSNVTIPELSNAVTLAAWDFTAGGDDVTLQKLTIHQYAVASTPSGQEVFLYMMDEDGGWERLTSAVSFNNDNDAKFTNVNAMIDKGETVTIAARANMGNYSASSEIAVEIEEAAAVTSTASDVDADFPVSGYRLGIASDVSAGTITFAKNGNPSDPDVGEDDFQLTKFKLTAQGGTENNEDARLEELGLLVSGSIDTDDLENFELYQTGQSEPLATTSMVDRNDIIRFTFDEEYILGKGDTRSFYVMADANTGRSNDTIKVYVDEVTDVVATGTTYGFGFQVVATAFDNSTACDSSSGACTFITLQGGDYTFSSQGPAAQDVRIDGQDVTFLNFTLDAATTGTFKDMYVLFTVSESATTQGLLNSSSGAANLENITIINRDTGEELYSPVDSDAMTTTATGANAISEAADTTGYIKFDDDVYVEAGDQLNLSIVGDIANNAELSDATITAALVLSSSLPEIRDVNNKVTTNSGALVPTSNITGKNMRVTASSLTLSKAGTPVTGPSVFVKGSSDVPFLGVIARCGTASECTITDISSTVYINDAGAALPTAAGQDTGNNNVYANEIVGSMYIVDDLGNQVASAKGITAAGALNHDNISYTLDAGESRTLYYIGDLSSDAYKNSNPEYIAVRPVTFTTEDVDGNAITASGTPNSDSATYVRVTDGGSLTVTTDASTPREDIAVSGSTDVELSVFNFESTDEAFIVTELALNNLQSSFAASSNLGDYDNNVSSLKISYTNSDGEVEEKTASLTSGQAIFTGLDLYVPADEDAELSAMASFNSIASNNATAGEFVRLDIALNDFEAIAQSSGETYDGSRIDFDYDAASDLDFGSFSWTTTGYRVNGADATVTSLGTSYAITVDTGSLYFPAGTLMFADDASGCASYTADTDQIFVLNTAMSGITTMTATLLDDGNGAGLADDDYICYASPGTGYLTSTARAHVYESKPTVALSATSPSGDRNVSTQDSAFIFTMSADDNEDVNFRAGYDLTTLDGWCNDDAADLATSSTTSVQNVDGSSCGVVGTDGASVNFNIDNTDGTVDASDYAYASFWFFWDEDDLDDNDSDLAPSDLTLAFDSDALLANSANTTDLAASNAINGTSELYEGVWYHFVDIAVPTGMSGTDDDYIGITSTHESLVDASDDFYIDRFMLYNEKIEVDVAAAAIIDKTNSADPVVAYLKESGTTVATGYVSQVVVESGTANQVASTNNSIARMTFVPTTTQGDIEIGAGSTKTYTVQLDTADLLSAQASGTDEAVTFSMDLGSSSEGSVTAGDIWWSADAPSPTIVKWLGRVNNTTLSGNTLNYQSFLKTLVQTLL